MKNTPPGPSKFSIFSELIPDRIVYYQMLLEDYGDIVHIPSFIRTYLINDPESIKHILKTNAKNYIKGGMAIKPLIATLGKGILVNEGEEWRARRHLTAPYFQPKSITHFVTTIHEKILSRIHNWQNFLKDDLSFDIAHEMMAIVFMIATKVLYSYEVDLTILDKIIAAISTENKYSVSPLVLMPWFPSIANLRYYRAKRFLRNYLQNLIQQRRQNSQRIDDLLDLLLHATSADKSTPLTDCAIFDEIKTFLMTGHETTGAALSWTFYLLAKNPLSQNKVYAEIKAVLGDHYPEYADLPKLNYTKMVFEEALRLYPPIWILGRKNIADDILGNYHIKAGSDILICTYALHRHPLYWEHPNDFIPERHAQENNTKQTPFSFIPFGGGSRICIASHLAVMEAMIIIVMLVQQFEFYLVEDHPVELDHFISLKPRYGIQVKIKNRN